MISANGTNDSEIRQALHSSLLSEEHMCAETLVIDELGLSHGRNRIDVATINGHLHGYEIKSGKDDLHRLPSQLAEYSKSLQMLTVIAAPKHIPQLRDIVPSWAGIIVATKNTNDEISFHVEQNARVNKDADAFAIAHLLWRNEAIALLRELGSLSKLERRNRVSLYTEIAQLVSAEDLIKLVKQYLANRTDWRVDCSPKQCDGLLLPASM